MLKNYFVTATRNLLRHKSNSIINISGLMVGFTAFLLIFILVQYERSFDDFHKQKNNIYRVVRIGKNPVNREYRTGVPFPVTFGLRTELPQLKNTTAIFGDRNIQVNITSTNSSGTKKFKENVLTAEPQFFQMFDFGLAAGDLKHALTEPNTVLLTKDIAVKYFGDWKIAINKTIRLYGNDMKITGILNNPPVNTDFPLSIVVSYVTLKNRLRPNDWDSIDDANYCFVQVDNHASFIHLNQQLAAFVEKHIKPVNPGYDLAFQPLNEIHFDDRYGNFSGRTFSKDLILGLLLIGIFLLIIACVNFINITTAQAITRAREVGVRKVLGSKRSQLLFQFFGETGITTLLAFIGSLLLIMVCMPYVNHLLDIKLSLTVLFSTRFVLLVLSALLLVTILSGCYPALILSGFKPVAVLKNNIITNNKSISLRRALVVFQFVIAQALIIGTLIVTSQMDYFRSADLGFSKEAIINAGFPGDSLSRMKVDLLHNELNKIPGIQQVSFSTFTPSAEGGWYTGLKTKESNNKQGDMVVCMKPADANYFHLYNLKLIAGRIYFPSDTMREFVVNEAAVKNLGIRNPSDMIGKQVSVSGKFFPVVGVVKDFHTSSLRDPIGAVVLTTNKQAYQMVNVKIDMVHEKTIITEMQRTWNKYFPNYVFEYSFLDQSISDYYKHENQLSQLYKLFSAIAIFISCLGLYGLISFMAIQRRKEIGIRKVLGAPVRDIVTMLSKEFTVLITIAFLIASPLAWYFMHQWLQQYTYRIDIGPVFFIVTIICSLLISWMTVGYTAIKAAVANPVKSLRSE